MKDSLLLSNPKELQALLTAFLKATKVSGLIPLIAIVGPTASGKTALGIALARAFDGEIVSADSRQVYTEMNIGTAKPTTTEQHSARHHLIDLVSPDQIFTLNDFQKLANQTISKIYLRKKIPILVGGTGLYINSITQNYLLPDSQPNPVLRKEMEDLALRKGKQAVHKILQKLDPDSAVQIHSNNLRYVIRAIEIARQTKQPKTPKTTPSPYATFYLSIDWPRAELYNRINRRIDGQITAGLIEETKQLLAKYPDQPPALTSLGYQEIGAYLAGRTSLAFALEEFKKHTRNYAKRQLTWFRKIKPVYLISGIELPDYISAFQKNQ